MPAVMVEIRPRSSAVEEPVMPDDAPETTESLEIISDLDKLTEYVMCSCSASDDNPY